MSVDKAMKKGAGSEQKRRRFGRPESFRRRSQQMGRYQLPLARNKNVA